MCKVDRKLAHNMEMAPSIPAGGGGPPSSLSDSLLTPGQVL